ncbi:hypothetical protein [Ectobacillus funiculus]|nr:hypothetical protein [Ectobacillus funiculus]
MELYKVFTLVYFELIICMRIAKALEMHMEDIWIDEENPAN